MIQPIQAALHPVRRATHSTLIVAALLTTLIACSEGTSPTGLAPPSVAAAASPFTTLTDPGGCVIEQLTSAEHDEFQVLSASPDGNWLALAERPEGMTGNKALVFEMNLATGEKTDLSHVLTNAGPYSPDGRFIVVAQDVDDADDTRTDIFEFERATGALRPIAPHEQWDWLPSYSPDGRFIVFNSYRMDGQADIHLFEKATGTLTRLTDDPGYDAHAQFSPDGKRILYHHQRGKRDDGGYIFDLMVYDMESGQTTRRTDGDHEEGYPAWAPDGRHIVFSSDVNGKPVKPNLYVLAADGQTTRLTEGDWKDSYAFWTRDGKFIYFTSDRAGVDNVYRMPMNGLDCVRE